MATEELTEYERKRLENIKRNTQMIASLKIHSHLSDLSAASKRIREEKSYKINSEKKKPKFEVPVVIRRSLRTRGMPPDTPGLPENFNDSSIKPTKSSPMKASSVVERDPLPQVPLDLDQTYEGVGSHLALVQKLARLTSNSNSSSKFARVKQELDRSIDLCSLKIEEDNVVTPGKRNTRSATRQSHTSNSNAEFERVKLEGIIDHRPLKLEDEFERVKLKEPIDPRSLRLQDDNIARVVPGRIFTVRFFPTTDMTMVVAGNKYGHLGFWDVKPQHGEEEDVIHLYRPHSAPISGISVHPFCLSKVYSSCYDGVLRMINIEREKFELLYTSSTSIFSLGRQLNDVNSLYLGEGPGGVNVFDQRVGKISMSWPLHVGRINSIDFSPANSNIMATSSTDGLACLWDLRNMQVKINDKHPERSALHTVKHVRAVHSAYFSPSGSCLATTSLDDNIGVLCGANFEEAFMIPHDNWTNRWVSSFRAVWGWDDTHLYIGNMKRRVDILSLTQKKHVYELVSSNMSAIPCRYDAHPCNVGMLAGATSGGQVYIWTASV